MQTEVTVLNLQMEIFTCRGNKTWRIQPVFEDEHGTYIFNSKDLCTIEFIDKILDIGVDSLKIEGRMKGIYYVANCVKVYRDAIDSYYSGNINLILSGWKN